MLIDENALVEAMKVASCITERQCQFIRKVIEAYEAAKAPATEQPEVDARPSTHQPVECCSEFETWWNPLSLPEQAPDRLIRLYAEKAWRAALNSRFLRDSRNQDNLRAWFEKSYVPSSHFSKGTSENPILERWGAGYKWPGVNSAWRAVQEYAASLPEREAVTLKNFSDEELTAFVMKITNGQPNPHSIRERIGVWRRGTDNV